MKDEIIHTHVPQNFIYPEIKEQDFRFGSDQVVGTVLREDGDWTDFCPPPELQRKNGVESSACFVEAQQHVLAILFEEQYGEPDKNFSSRFNIQFSDPTPQGGDPLKAAQSFRSYGLIPEEMLPFNESIDSWEEFCSFSGGDKVTCLIEGQKWRSLWEPKYDIVFTKHESVETKFAKIREALKYSPLSVSVTAWYLKNGLYIKANHDDNHLVTLVHVDNEGYSYVFDTYSPFMKKLDKNFNFDFGIRWTLDKNTDTARSNWVKEILTKLISLTKDLLALKSKQVTKREQMLHTAKESLGFDASPNDLAPDEFACAESITNVMKKVDSGVPILTGTWSLYDYFKLRPSLFKFLTESEALPGDIILSPTGMGKGKIPNGHVGCVGEDGVVMSNNSKTGKFDTHLTLEKWRARYKILGGYPVFIIRWL